MENNIPCKYYNSRTGCKRENCPYSHSISTISPSASQPSSSRSRVACKFYAQGYCRRGNQCYFYHSVEAPSSASAPVEETEYQDCSICYETPKEYGLLTGCNHVFCLSCIRKWRSKSSKGDDLRHSNVLNECPVCRSESEFIIPSVIYAKDEKKLPIIKSYKLALSKIPCKHFFRPGPNLHVCPFDDNCFYSHNDAQGNRIPCKQRPVRSPLDPRIMSEGLLNSIRFMVMEQMNLDWDDIEDEDDDDIDYDEDDYGDHSFYFESVI